MILPRMKTWSWTLGGVTSEVVGTEGKGETTHGENIHEFPGRPKRVQSEKVGRPGADGHGDLQSSDAGLRRPCQRSRHQHLAPVWFEPGSAPPLFGNVPIYPYFVQVSILDSFCFLVANGSRKKNCSKHRISSLSQDGRTMKEARRINAKDRHRRRAPTEFKHPRFDQESFVEYRCGVVVRFGFLLIDIIWSSPVAFLYRKQVDH